MEHQRAEYIRDVPSDEAMHETVDAAKALTWEHYREHAVFELVDGRKVLVRGGPYGIDLIRSAVNDRSSRERDRLFIDAGGKWVQVERLIFHVHPVPTGPSDADLRILRILGQPESMLYELFGPLEGTVIRPKK